MPSTAMTLALGFWKSGDTTGVAAAKAKLSPSTVRTYLMRHPEVKEGVTPRRRGHQPEEDCLAAKAGRMHLETGISICQAAKAVGVSQAAVSKWLKRWRSNK